MHNNTMMVNTTTDFHLSCHCQSNLLKLTIPLNPTPSAALSDTDTDPTENASKASADTAIEVQSHADEAIIQALSNSAPLLVCDCSICVKRLIIWSLQPMDRITIVRGCERGRGTLKSYSFAEKAYDHCVSLLDLASESDVWMVMYKHGRHWNARAMTGKGDCY